MMTTGIFLIAGLLSTIVFPSQIFALTDPVNIRTSYFLFQSGIGNFDSLGGIISALMANAIVIAGVIFFLLIIYGGWQFVIYGGTNNPSARVQKGKNLITWGLIGFLLVFSAYFILQIISYVFGINFMNLPTT
jgi:hypothetical protein